jgi:hypothetical protein
MHGFKHTNGALLLRKLDYYICPGLDIIDIEGAGGPAPLELANWRSYYNAKRSCVLDALNEKHAGVS